MQKPIYITQFNKGISGDPRIADSAYSQMLQHFDSFTFPRKLVPYRSSESGDTDAANKKIVEFLYTNSRIYGLGVTTGTAIAELYYKNTYNDGAWSSPTTAASASGARNEKLFVHYKGALYGARAGTHIWSYTIATNTFLDTARALTHTNLLTNGLVHSKDDILYIAYDNKIAKNNAGTWTNAALTLPTNMIVTSLCEFGNFLAIACKAADIGSNSVVYLWDRDATLATVSENIDWGPGYLNILEEVGGYLIGITMVNQDHNNFFPRLIFKYYAGQPGAQQFGEIVGSGTQIGTPTLYTNKQVANNRIYFMANITINGIQYNGVWSLGRTDVSSNFGVSLSHLPNNDTGITATGTLNGFFLTGEYMFISYIASSAYAMSKTDDTSTFSSTSVYETPIMTLGDAAITKKLVGASVMYEALPAAGVVTLKYKKDEETTFSQIFTTGTDSALAHSAVNIENLTAAGDTVTMTIASPAVVTLTAHGLVAGNPIVFSTTGALPTGVTAGATYYVISTSLAANTFQFSATLAGSAVNTSGSQSGVHTMNRTRTLPEFKEITFRIESTGGAVITGLKFKVEVIDKDIY